MWLFKPLESAIEMFLDPLLGTKSRTRSSNNRSVSHGRNNYNTPKARKQRELKNYKELTKYAGRIGNFKL